MLKFVVSSCFSKAKYYRDVADNEIVGTIPETLTFEDFPNLNVFNIADNQFSGSIPEGFYTLANLERWYVA